MLQRIFIYWIIYQLLVIGFLAGNISHDLRNKTYDCNHIKVSRFMDVTVYMMFPLAAFMSSSWDDSINKYCQRMSYKNSQYGQ